MEEIPLIGLLLILFDLLLIIVPFDPGLKVLRTMIGMFFL
jgi:hypothetical protein